MSTFPHTIFVRMEKDGKSTFLVAESDALDIIDGNGPTTYGVYELVQKQRAVKNLFLLK